ncbi:hypothetical protein ACH49M_29540 [Rhodococcus qingshengii]|uniref:Uncharacterized protein n=2 Tax=Actinomycetes TaxID=1760 RepID=A0ABV5XQ96_9NOCA|nr:hypothetical protein [Rhodococcus qingshengii]EEN86023.1 hypothetical protein RHOER0001_4617 [Rhodococcus erythropolis SK121]MBP1054573.1 hypothetical protein [Rhodococcus qingshengii]
MHEFAELIDKVRSRHERELHRLLRKALVPGTSRTIARKKPPPKLIGRSILDRTVEVRVFASHLALDTSTTMTGPYPAGSVLMMTFVGGRHVRTGEPVALDPIEADAWGLALVPPGFEEYALRLGTIAKFSAGVRHYRMVVASDGTACVMPPADKEVLLTSMG